MAAAKPGVKFQVVMQRMAWNIRILWVSGKRTYVGFKKADAVNAHAVLSFLCPDVKVASQKKIREYWNQMTTELKQKFERDHQEPETVKEFIDWFDNGWVHSRDIDVLGVIPSKALLEWPKGLVLLEEFARNPSEKLDCGVLEFALLRILVILQEQLWQQEGQAFFGEAFMVLNLMQALKIGQGMTEKDVGHVFRVYSAFPRAGLVLLSNVEVERVSDWLSKGFLCDSPDESWLIGTFGEVIMSVSALWKGWSEKKEQSKEARKKRLEQAVAEYVHLHGGEEQPGAERPLMGNRKKRPKGKGQKRPREAVGAVLDVGQGEGTGKLKASKASKKSAASSNPIQSEATRKSTRQRKVPKHYEEALSFVTRGSGDECDSDGEQMSESDQDSDDYQEK